MALNDLEEKNTSFSQNVNTERISLRKNTCMCIQTISARPLYKESLCSMRYIG